jgi:hypothetical protein
MEQQIEKYWELVEKNDFENLNQSERQFIRTHFTPADFKADRIICISAKNDNEQITSNRKAVVVAHATTKREKRILPPVLAFAAGLAIMFGLFQLFQESTEGLVFTQKEYIVDTVYQQKIIRDTIKIQEASAPEVRYVYRDGDKNQEVKFPKTQEVKLEEFREANQATPTLITDEIQNKGTSGIDNSFVVEVPSEFGVGYPK